MIFCMKSGAHLRPLGKHSYFYLPKGVIITHSSWDSSSSSRYNIALRCQVLWNTCIPKSVAWYCEEQAAGIVCVWYICWESKDQRFVWLDHSFLQQWSKANPTWRRHIPQEFQCQPCVWVPFSIFVHGHKVLDMHNGVQVLSQAIGLLDLLVEIDTKRTIK